MNTPAVTDNALNVKSLYVMNMIGRDANLQKQVNPKSAFVFEAIGDSRQRERVIVENTWLPQDLSIQALPKDIHNARDFRHAVTSGYLVILTDEQAAKIKQSPEGRKEQARLDQKKAERNEYLSKYGEESTQEIKVFDTTGQEKQDDPEIYRNPNAPEVGNRTDVPDQVFASLGIAVQSAEQQKPAPSQAGKKSDVNVGLVLMERVSAGTFDKDTALNALKAMVDTFSDAERQDVIKFTLENNLPDEFVKILYNK